MPSRTASNDFLYLSVASLRRRADPSSGSQHLIAPRLVSSVAEMSNQSSGPCLSLSARTPPPHPRSTFLERLNHVAAVSLVTRNAQLEFLGRGSCGGGDGRTGKQANRLGPISVSVFCCGMTSKFPRVREGQHSYSLSDSLIRLLCKINYPPSSKCPT